MAGCNLCPRSCGARREAGEVGICGQTFKVRAARAALHYWEEPCISGEEGSGAVFFSGCPLHCVFCQNKRIADGEGMEVSIPRLSEIFLELEGKGANNINLVTAGHFAPQVAEALSLAKGRGLSVPVVYNSGGYEKAETLKLLDGLVDIYLPDFKYMDPALSEKYSHAADYSAVAKAALAEMVRQVGPPEFFGEAGESLMRRGVIVRHLVLPGCVEDSRRVIRYLYETYGDSIYISILNQFTPLPQLARYPELNRRVMEAEYDEAVDYAIALGVENGFIQEGETAEESFIPAFDGEGI